MSSQRFLFAALVTVWIANSPLLANVTTIATTGNSAAGISLATWDQFESVTLNDTAQVLVSGELTIGAGASPQIYKRASVVSTPPTTAVSGSSIHWAIRGW